MLAQQRRLAFASKTPGRTQHINLFELGPKDAPDALFADLPGYGYAAVARGAKLRWQQVMADYLELRRSLSGVVLMIDSRLGATDLDRQLMSFMAQRVGSGEVKLLVLLTKADKLSRNEADCGTGRDAGAARRVRHRGGRYRRHAVLGAEEDRRRGRGARAARLGARPAPMIETFAAVLPHGITLSCRAAGAADAPLLLFLHGFPEAAFVWDELLLHFAGRYRCVAPNLRGFERSSAPAEVEAYRAKHLVADIEALTAHCNRVAGRAADAPLRRWSRTTGAAPWPGTSRRSGAHCSSAW